MASFETIDYYKDVVANFKGAPLRHYPGVTRVLSGSGDKSWLDAWRKRVGEAEADRIVEESKSIGISLDTIFNASLKEKHNFNQLEYKSEVGYTLWKQLENTLDRIEPISVQMHVWSDTLELQGYLDCLGFLDGVPTLIDCKNSKREKYEEHLQDYFLQCTMYTMLLYEMTGLVVKQAALLVARRDSNFPQIEIRSTKPFVATALKRIQEYHSTREQNRVKT